MTLNLNLLPTDEDELTAQVETAFPPEEQKPQAAPETGKAKPEAEAEYTPPDSDETEPEYLPPDESLAEGCEMGLHIVLNPILGILGVRPLDEDEVKTVASEMAGIAATYPNLKLPKVTPRRAAFASFGMCLYAIAKPRVAEMNAAQMRNVTPESPPEPTPQQGDEPAEEFNPIYG